MNEHLTIEQLRSFGSRTASPGELVRMDQHLNGCEQCRRQLPFDPGRIDSIKLLIDDGTDPDHLSYEMIEAYVQSLVDDVDREIVTSHMESCTECHDRVQGLQRFVTVLSTPSRNESATTSAHTVERPTFWSRMSTALKAPGWSYVVIGAAAMLVIGIMIQRHSDRFPLVGSQGSMEVDIPVEYGSMIEIVAATPASQVPDFLRQVIQGTSTEPGTIAPNRIVIRTQRPSFQWKSVAGADSYRLEIMGGTDQIRTGFISDTNWAPEFDLQRGRIYSWTVTAYVSLEPMSTSGGTRSARFGIISDEDERTLTKILKRYPNNGLLIAAAYLNSGLLDDAQLKLNSIDSSRNELAKKLQIRIDGIRNTIK